MQKNQLPSKMAGPSHAEWQNSIAFVIYCRVTVMDVSNLIANASYHPIQNYKDGPKYILKCGYIL